MNHQPSAESGMITDPRLPVPLQIDRSWFDDLAGRLDKGGPWGDYRLAQLAVEGEKSRLVTSFEELQCLKHLGALSPLPIRLIPPDAYCSRCRAERFSPMRWD